MVSRKQLAIVSLALAWPLADAVPAAAQAGDGFLFEPPSVVFGVHGGFARPETSSDLFDFVTRQLTLGRGDFDGVAAGGTVFIPLSGRLGVEVRGTYFGRVSGSEFRDWVDQDDLPIEQRTQFIRVPVIASARAYLVPPGRRIGSFVWIPSRVSPYVGAGVGAVWYRFRQTGDFVDFEDLGVFADELESSGWAPAARVSAGMDISVTPRVAITTGADYLWARRDLSGDFLEFDPIDLSGFSATVGVALRL